MLPIRLLSVGLSSAVQQGVRQPLHSAVFMGRNQNVAGIGSHV
jgi:hypothetical protein